MMFTDDEMQMMLGKNINSRPTTSLFKSKAETQDAIYALSKPDQSMAFWHASLNPITVQE
jgi:hypothetical protein